MVAISSLIRTRKQVGVVVLAAVALVIAISILLELDWILQVQDFLNEHGGWTFVSLAALAAGAGFVAYVHRSMHTIALAVLGIVLIIVAAVTGNVIGA